MSGDRVHSTFVPTHNPVPYRGGTVRSYDLKTGQLAHDQLFVSSDRTSSEHPDLTAVYPVAGCGQSVCGPAWTTDSRTDILAIGGDVLFAPYVGGNLYESLRAYGPSS